MSRRCPIGVRGAYLAVGNFDGVHHGHCRLIARLRANAEAAGVPALALTFDPHPVLALASPRKAPVPLVWTERKVALLKEAGAETVGVFATGPWLLGLTAREFFDRVIVGRFGRGGWWRGRTSPSAATAEVMPRCWPGGVAGPASASKKSNRRGSMNSSSRHHASAIVWQEGRVAAAARFLGRPHRIRGVVYQGAGRGTGLGFPTANLDAIDTLIPSDGVYAAYAIIEGLGHGLPSRVSHRAERHLR